MCDHDYDPCEVYTSTWRRARKQHRCCACAESISAGQRYRYTSGIFDGHPFDMKHCARCWHLLKVLSDRGQRTDAELDCGETWEEAFGEPPPESVAALAFMTADEAQRLVK